jgi:hypothetical protein
MTCRVLPPSPSRGLGGGIGRYLQTAEWAFAVSNSKEGSGCMSRS